MYVFTTVEESAYCPTRPQPHLVNILTHFLSYVDILLIIVYSFPLITYNEIMQHSLLFFIFQMSFSSTSMDQEIRSLREKLNKLRQQNACLVSQNHSLMTKMESVHFELTQSRAKVCFLKCDYASRN